MQTRKHVLLEVYWTIPVCMEIVTLSQGLKGDWYLIIEP